MATDYVAEILAWDQPLNFRRSPGGIPEELTFRGEFVFIGGLELEGRVLAPSRHRGKRFRVWLSALTPPPSRQAPISSLGGLSERVTQPARSELIVSLNLPEDAMEAAAICLGSIWKYLRVTTAGRAREGARVIAFSFTAEIGHDE